MARRDGDLAMGRRIRTQSGKKLARGASGGVGLVMGISCLESVGRAVVAVVLVCVIVMMQRGQANLDRNREDRQQTEHHAAHASLYANELQEAEYAKVRPIP